LQKSGLGTLDGVAGLGMRTLVLEVELSEYGWLQAAVAGASCCMAAEPLFLEDLGQLRAASEPEGLRAARHCGWPVTKGWTAIAITRGTVSPSR
jgi:hypothetical protein